MEVLQKKKPVLSQKKSSLAVRSVWSDCCGQLSHTHSLKKVEMERRWVRRTEMEKLSELETEKAGELPVKEEAVLSF